MDKMTQATKNITTALNTLCEALESYEKMQNIGSQQASVILANEDLERALRDSLIQRFEFCSDLFWKYLKKYEEEVLKITLDVFAPRSVILQACKAKVISESDAHTLLEMIKQRNMTSHIYKEEIADQISVLIPGYYQLMRKYVDKLTNEL